MKNDIRQMSRRKLGVEATKNWSIDNKSRVCADLRAKST